jgi:S-adenosylmethionine synthetase
MSHLFTSESVTGGHPDKLADTISDAVLDAYLAQDPHARVACETYVTNGLCLVGGEVRSTARVEVADVAREVIRDAGYGDPSCGYPADDIAVMNIMGRQSPEIAQGVDRGDPDEQGAGDQGLMFGYACRDTDALMPLAIHLAHELTRGLTELRESGTLSYLRPDGKSQVTVECGDDDRPRRIHTVVVSTQHAPSARREQIEADVRRHLFPRLPPDLMDAATVLHVNPTGAFTIGGPKGDTGLTAGRSSWTRTAAPRPTAAAPSAGRTPRRWTAARPTWRATSPRTSWRPSWPTRRRSRSPTRSASPNPSRCGCARSGGGGRAPRTGTWSERSARSSG